VARVTGGIFHRLCMQHASVVIWSRVLLYLQAWV